jgi:hypothetical protein
VQSDGTVTRLKEQKRTDARDRQAVARDVLDGLEVIGHPSSYFLWLPLPGEARADQVAAALMRETISVSTAEPFTTTKNPPHAIRLALPANDDVPMRLLRIGRPCPNKIVFVAPLSCNRGRVVATRCGKHRNSQRHRLSVSATEMLCVSRSPMLVMSTILSQNTSLVVRSCSI